LKQLTKNRKAIEALLVACAITVSLTVSIRAIAVDMNDEQYKETKAAAERILQIAQKIKDDIKHIREKRARLQQKLEEERAQEAAQKQAREKKQADELAAARSAAERKAREAALAKERQSAAVQEEKAERERNARLTQTKAEEEKLVKEQERIDKIIEDYRKQGLLGGEIKYGVDL
jgi:colicin import membrane protein